MAPEKGAGSAPAATESRARKIFATGERQQCFRLQNPETQSLHRRFADGRESPNMFLNNYKCGNQSDTNARDAAILLSFALQHGADINDIRKAVCRDSKGQALSPIGEALDRIAAGGAP
jgi:hypothetical protein